MHVSIRPNSIADKPKVFDWLSRSNLTAEMLGPPKFPDNLAPTWEEFDEDYLDYYFDGSAPKKGRCFIIFFNELEVGQINYNPIDPLTKTTELDIWLSDKKYTGKGIGVKAIQLICKHIFDNLDCRKILIQPSARNPYAIKAYKKAGFIEQAEIPPDFELDYQDSVLLVLNNENAKTIFL